MTGSYNGFTRPANDDPGFESAAAASRRLRNAAPEPAAPESARPSVPAAPDAFHYAQNLTAAQAQRLAGAPLALDYARIDEIAPTDRRWAWVEVDTSAIRHNVSEVRRAIGARCRVMAVVKADGYGHGACEAATAALAGGAEQVAVSTVSEGVALRKAGVTAPIALLEQPPITSVPLLVAYGIAPAIYEPDFAVAYGEAADLHGLVAPYHLAIDTGMNRLGVDRRDAVEFLQQVSFHRALSLAGTFTHFASADSRETLDYEIQMRRFVETIEQIRAAGFDPGLVHAANSAAALRFPDARFDMVRCGIALYGIHPCEATRGRIDLRPAMSVHARIIDTRLVPMSEGVSFGLRYRSPGNVRVCTLPIGYGDGLQRALSGQIDFIMDGRYFRQVGDICMDQCMFEVDLRDRANQGRFNPQVGDEVIIVGGQGAAEVTIDELAERLGTVPYELLVGFGLRLPRIS